MHDHVGRSSHEKACPDQPDSYWSVLLVDRRGLCQIFHFMSRWQRHLHTLTK